jgi:hypothetical protein
MLAVGATATACSAIATVKAGFAMDCNGAAIVANRRVAAMGLIAVTSVSAE